MGDWLGLAIDARGWLWHAGKWTAGLITYVPDPHEWFARNGPAFDEAFGDGGPRDGSVQPVFPVAAAGHPVHPHLRGGLPGRQGLVRSLGPVDGVEQTVASFDRGRLPHLPLRRPRPAGGAVADLVCLPDGRLVLAGGYSGLALWDPRPAPRRG